ncbi:kiaa1033 [Nesidiocoris tenuis]|uniref:Kiaa1033 n=1 Tax=Nesidiocoris tenuis TaxID=355587 RepID=A0ABN7AHJ4_9HEMI|nr:kiaa1033 [Nesidiocoris tenuis]
MHLMEQASQEVLFSYGQFLEGLSTTCYNVRQKLHTDSFASLDTFLGVQIERSDHSLIPDKVDADNNMQNKILIVFAAIYKEIKNLEKELMDSYVPVVYHYGEACPDKADRQKALSSICKFLPFLYDLMTFVQRCRQTLNHLLQQLVCHYEFQRNPDSPPLTQFLAIFSALSCLLKLFVTIDALFEGNSESLIKEHLSILEKTLSTLGDEGDEVKRVRTVVEDINNNLLNHNVYDGMVLTQLENRHPLGNCEEFRKHLNYYFKSQLSSIESREGEVESLTMWSDVLITYVFAVNVLDITDKKVDRLVRDTTKKFTIATLCDGVMWIPSNFVMRHLGDKLRDNLEVNQPTLCRSLEQAETNLLRDIKLYTFKVYKWSLQMTNVLSPDAVYVNLSDVSTANLCFEGLALCRQMKLLMNTIIYLHSTLCKPMTKTVAVSLCKITELIQAVKSIFQQRHLDIGYRINHIIQRFSLQGLNLVVKAKKSLTSDDGADESQKGAAEAFELTEKLLYGACIDDNMLVIQLALSRLSHTQNPLGTDGSLLLGKALSNLQTICSLKQQLEDATDCNLVFKEPHILPIYFKHVMDSNLSLFRFQLVLQNLPKRLPENGPAEDNGLLTISKETFETMVVPKLCHRIETFLRLRAHSHLQEGEYLPMDQNDFREHLNVPTLTIAGHYVNIHALVENYLDKIFYDLATVALHDWQTYREMRSLAEHELKLFTVEDYLPSQTLAQGLDILDIMRNIDIFVSRYMYNLNNQCFIESSSNNKHLSTIKINQIANSIWTHGTGIMNTTTNFVYQYLKKKILQFSKFLYDEKISSRLLKDKAHFELLKNDHQPFFPYDRALKFNKTVSRMGITDGIGQLDQCRILITHLGNALGYIRAVRTGGLHYCLEASSYLPELSFVYSSKENLRDSGRDSVDCLIQFVCSLVHNLTESSEYLKILTDVFSSIFDTPENNHLKLFPILLPSLTINYVNHIVTEKEKVSKRNKNGTIFTDDGFAIGVTYLLSVLNLHDEFESLHWFDSVSQMYSDEESAIEKQLALQTSEMKSGDNTLKLSIRRLKLYKKEFDLLYYSMNSARVFFY